MNLSQKFKILPSPPPPSLLILGKADHTDTCLLPVEKKHFVFIRYHPSHELSSHPKTLLLANHSPPSR